MEGGGGLRGAEEGYRVGELKQLTLQSNVRRFYPKRIQIEIF